MSKTLKFSIIVILVMSFVMYDFFYNEKRILAKWIDENCTSRSKCIIPVGKVFKIDWDRIYFFYLGGERLGKEKILGHKFKKYSEFCDMMVIEDSEENRIIEITLWCLDEERYPNLNNLHIHFEQKSSYTILSKDKNESLCGQISHNVMGVETLYQLSVCPEGK